MANKLSFVGEKVKLGEVCAINSGGTPKRTVQDYWVDGTIPWVKISDIRQKFVIETEEFITEEGLTHSSAKLLEPDTLLFPYLLQLVPSAYSICRRLLIKQLLD